MAETPIEVRIRDPLGELTRKERRNLLAISTVAIVVVHTGLVPTRFSGLGIDFGPLERVAFLKILTGAVAYFLVAFVVYAVADWLSGRWRLEVAFKADLDAFEARLRDDLVHRSQGQTPLAEVMADVRNDLDAYLEKSGARLRRATTPIVAFRAAFELAVPLGLGIYALKHLAEFW
jgi:ABC-type multidrug transport system fused ATPase/permease subunit